ncbi:MAG: hypothetical protein OHK0022_54500 [Roseiflexaceae bacterium]
MTSPARLARLRVSLPALYWTVAAYLLAGALLGFVRLWPALNQPFGGFIWQYDYAQGSSVSYDTPHHWAATVAGLRPHTTILSVAGRSPLEFPALYRSLPVGTPVRYEIVRTDGTRASVNAPVARFTLPDLLDAYGMLFLAALSAAVCGGVLVQSSREPSLRLFGFAMLLFSASGFYHSHNGNINTFYDARYATALLWAPTPALLGAVFCHIALIYPAPLPLLRGWPRLVRGIYLLAGLLGLALAVGLVAGFSAWGGQLQLQARYASMALLLVGMACTLVRGLLALCTPQGTLGFAERRRIQVVGAVWILTLVLLLGSVIAVNLRLPTIFELVSFACLLLPIANLYALRNAEMVVQLERDHLLRAQLLEDLREIHVLQDRIMAELADEIHDHPLAESKAIEMRLFALCEEVRAGRGSAGWLRALEQIHGQSVALTHTLRQMVDGAKPVDFSRERLSEAVARTVAQFNAQTDRTGYSSMVDPAVDQAPAETLDALYWILRAALNNVRDHACAAHCRVVCAPEGDVVVLTITDDGCGAPAPAHPAASYRRHFGLASMRSRAARLGGTCTVEFHTQGTRVEVRVPLAQPAHVEGLRTHPDE